MDLAFAPVATVTLCDWGVGWLYGGYLARPRHILYLILPLPEADQRASCKKTLWNDKRLSARYPHVAQGLFEIASQRGIASMYSLLSRGKRASIAETPLLHGAHRASSSRDGVSHPISSHRDTQNPMSQDISGPTLQDITHNNTFAIYLF